MGRSIGYCFHCDNECMDNCMEPCFYCEGLVCCDAYENCTKFDDILYQECVIKDDWVRAGTKGLVVGEPFYHEYDDRDKWWIPVIMEDDGFPTFIESESIEIKRP